MEDQVDPWCGNGNGSTKSTEDTDDNKKGFKDNFVVEPFDVESEVPERLPDHEEYLNTLETKLAKLGTTYWNFGFYQRGEIFCYEYDEINFCSVRNFLIFSIISDNC